MVKQPVGSGEWNPVEARGAWYLKNDGFCDDCKFDFNGTFDTIWCWRYSSYEIAGQGRHVWIWLCEHCAKSRGIIW